ncbi:DUF2280 domain-containing protein [Pseudomonas alliivorans]|uniref:DUF2280 domain-containing protein n=1 Tax=Pseudomonas alliivorans TaxID=2810613 RepID=UPI001AE577DF|nr:DUF2280 domain-containing protein [Pseudomonas alliivorans]MBP0943103.1 DUF2280 domain-containing protein [Pseudomonas alliivorans]MEE4881199.1 DUF2280 domain-containing protein [Pseudomonas alliivorans]MEE4932503.1 DUF2280 domain-containing protein [Pseudomonas alliivorans]MEE4937966.1 DUF2280 domain-containing protein [Pseudomonas alliivorans]MEE4943101.1 DUF2280 domain-containing protein [Pseudomonas alliivorans]
MATLNNEVKAFIVQALACFDTPSQVSAAVRDEFKIDVTRQQCEAHDPTKRAGRDLAKRWVTLFNDTRKRFREETAEIPIANRSYRLRALGRIVEKAENMRNLALALQVLEQAAKESGDMYVNRRIEPEKPLGSHADQQHAVAEYTLEPDENVPTTPYL